jgi:hypothetical protein
MMGLKAAQAAQTLLQRIDQSNHATRQRLGRPRKVSPLTDSHRCWDGGCQRHHDDQVWTMIDAVAGHPASSQKDPPSDRDRSLDLAGHSDVEKPLGNKVQNVEEVARFLRKSPSWVYKNWQELGGRKLGGSLFFPDKEDLYERIFSQREGVEVRLHPQGDQAYGNLVQNSRSSFRVASSSFLLSAHDVFILTGAWVWDARLGFRST